MAGVSRVFRQSFDPPEMKRLKLKAPPVGFWATHTVVSFRCGKAVVYPVVSVKVSSLLEVMLGFPPQINFLNLGFQMNVFGNVSMDCSLCCMDF